MDIDPTKPILPQLPPYATAGIRSDTPVDGTQLDRVVAAGVHYEAMSGVDLTAMIVLPRLPADAMARMGIKGARDAPTVKVFAELQTLSISSTRSFAAVRRLGEVQAAAYTRGGRTIAGTMVFTTFNRDVFAELYRVHPEDVFDPSVPMHVDQIPEFNILIQGTNEMGAMVNAALIGVNILNFGTTLSVNDLMIESTYTYVARLFYPMVSSVRQFHEAIMRGYSPTVDDTPLGVDPTKDIGRDDIIGNNAFFNEMNKSIDNFIRYGVPKSGKIKPAVIGDRYTDLP